jgi:subtilisin family serine protease
MSEQEYIVVVHRGIDLSAVDAELSASTGSGPIPNRAVDVANARVGSNRMTHWMLTEDEATALEADERVLSVEIPPELRDDITIGLNASQSGQFFRGSNNSSDVNWGLRRVGEGTNVYGNSTTIAGNHDYALDGAGIDIVIQDSGLQVDHPEFNDEDGNTRVQQINWYTESGLSGTQSVNHYRDWDGHGTHVAGTAAGLTYGFAKAAHVYSQKLAGLEGSGDSGTGISISDAFDAIRLWHSAKTNGRPTVVNMSWGYSTNRGSNNPTNGVYRNSGWGYAGQTDQALWDSYGIVPKISNNRNLPAQVSSVNADIEDMIDAGIHVCIAAGNDYYKADFPGSSDYNNQVYVGSGPPVFYNRPSSPYSDQAFIVGNLEANVFNDGGTYKDRPRGSSKKGPAVNIWAPGTSIMSAASTVVNATYPDTTYPGDSNYKIMSISGTSMAAPQVAGVLALYLQSTPNITPSELFDKVVGDTKSVIYSTGNDQSYSLSTTSLVGSNNRHLFNRYAVSNPYSISGSVTITGFSE